MMRTKFDIQVSDTCNLTCKHCLMDSSLHKCKVNFNNIIKTLKQQQCVDTIYLSGGEPLITENNAKEIFNLMKEFPYTKFKIVTNLCYELTPYRLAVMKNVESLQTSFDIGIRFGNIKNLNKWYHNCKWLLNNGYPLEVICTITSHIISKGPEKIIKLFNDMGFNAYKFAVGSYLGTFKDNKDLHVTKQQHVDFMNKMLDIIDLKNGTIKEIKEKTWTACKYMELQPINQNGELVHCAAWEKVDSKCLNSIQCYSCTNYRYCGGRCCSTPCMFDKDIYDRVMNEYYANDEYKHILEGDY